jgi:hypothetical protein
MWILYEVDIIMEKCFKNEMEINEDAFSKFIQGKKYH